jgi:hypothetical protein
MNRTHTPLSIFAFKSSTSASKNGAGANFSPLLNTPKSISASGHCSLIPWNALRIDSAFDASVPGKACEMLSLGREAIVLSSVDAERERRARRCVDANAFL